MRGRAGHSGLGPTTVDMCREQSTSVSTGVGPRVTQVILAETGEDMSRFPRRRIWPPGPESRWPSTRRPGKRSPAGARHGNKWLNHMLVEVAGAAAPVQQASAARSWPWTSRRLGGVIAFGQTTRPRRSVGVANDVGEATGEVLEKYTRTSVLPNQESFGRRPGFSTGMLAPPDDTPGRGEELQQSVQQRGLDEPVHSRMMADAATS